MADEGDWADVLRRPPGPADEERRPGPVAVDDAPALGVLAVHGALGVVSLLLIGFGLFGWLDRLLDRAFDDVPDTAFFLLVVRYPAREELSKALVLALGALGMALLGLRHRTRQLPALLLPALGVGLGFAVIETLVDRRVSGGGEFVAILVFRIVGHSLCVAWSALGLALAVRRLWWWTVPLSLALAILVHSGNNYLSVRPGATGFVWVVCWMLAFSVVAGLLVKDLGEWPPRLRLPRP